MLYGDVDISKEPLQRMLAMDGVGPGGVKQDVHCFDRFPHPVSDSQPGLSNLPAWVLTSIADSSPSLSHSVEHVGAGAPLMIASASPTALWAGARSLRSVEDMVELAWDANCKYASIAPRAMPKELATVCVQRPAKTNRGW